MKVLDVYVRMILFLVLKLLREHFKQYFQLFIIYDFVLVHDLTGKASVSFGRGKAVAFLVGAQTFLG